MSDINITNNFNAPIGQHIDHVDTIDFHMDGEGNFQFGMVEKVNSLTPDPSTVREGSSQPDEELFHFIHPSMDDEQEGKIHNEVKRLVKRQGIQMICQHLLRMEADGKLLLPPNPAVIYKELVRLGMPTGEGYSEKYFKNYFNQQATA